MNALNPDLTARFTESVYSMLALDPDNLPRQQPTNDCAELLEDAVIIQKLLPSLANKAIQDARYDMDLMRIPAAKRSLGKKSIEIGDLKTLIRMQKKAVETYAGGAYDIKDCARARIHCDTAQEIAAVCAQFESYEHGKIALPGGAYVIRTVNQFENPTPTGHSSFKANIAIPLGEKSPRPYHIVEIMVVHAPFEAAIKNAKMSRAIVTHPDQEPDTSHNAYETTREMDDRFRRADAPISQDIYKRRAMITHDCRLMHDKARTDHHLDDVMRFLQVYRELKHQYGNNAAQDAVVSL